MSKVKIFDHPLIQHKTTILRKKETSSKEFRECIEEITTLMCYEALKDLANGQSTKIVVPSNLQGLASLATSFKEITKE